MTADQVLTIAIALLGLHWLADYPLQGDFLAAAKQKGPLRVYHLVAHAGIHGALVTLAIGPVFGILEWLLHGWIDELKVRGRTSFATDQALHLACKLSWLLVLLFVPELGAGGFLL